MFKKKHLFLTEKYIGFKYVEERNWIEFETFLQFLRFLDELYCKVVLCKHL